MSTTKFSVVAEYAQEFLFFCNYTTRVKRNVIDTLFTSNIRSMQEDGIYSQQQAIAFDAIWYGIHWYIQTGRASVEIEKEIHSLTGFQILKLVFKIWADGANTSGEAGDWLNKWQGSYARLCR
jgi:hypothetical protein